MNSAQATRSIPSDVRLFRRIYRDTQARLFPQSVVVAVAFYLAFVCWDLVVAPMLIGPILRVRVALAGLSMVLVLVSVIPGARRWYYWYYVVLLSAAGLGVAAILWLVPQGFAIGIAGVVLCIAASSAVFHASGWATAVAGSIAGLGTVALMVLHGEPDYLVRSHAIFLVSAVGVSVLHSVQAERSAFEVFRAHERLKSEKERTQDLLRDVTSMRQQRLTWLENLARFLRHELSNQIVAVSTSIDLAKSDGSPFGSKTYLERAQRSLGRMRGLVSSATEATSLEAALSVEETERVDLSGVLMDRVTAFQELHPARPFTLKLRPGLSVDGNEARVAQLLDKLLGNAVEHSAADAEVRVGLGLVDGGWLELTVENEGDPLPEDRERIFEAFVSTQKRAGNLGLGLFVAQSIVVNHGGQIRAEGLPDGSGARFVVRLPKARGEGRGAEREELRLVAGERAKTAEDQPPQ